MPIHEGENEGGKRRRGRERGRQTYRGKANDMYTFIDRYIIAINL